jgi:hypothetical protein
MTNHAKTLAIVGAWALMASLSATAQDTTNTAPVAPAPVRILKTATPVMVDGVLDEPCWQSAEAIRVEYAFGKTGVKATTLPGVVQFAWDNNYLYMGYKTFDTDLRAAGNGEIKGPQGNRREGCELGGSNDVVELCISFNDPNFFWEVQHNALNNFSDIWVIVPPTNSPFARSSRTSQGVYFSNKEYLDESEFDYDQLERAVKLKPNKDGKPSTVNKSDDVDTGYIGELRFPWKELGPPQEFNKAGIHGQTITLFCAVQNRDLPPGKYHSCPDLKMDGVFFHTTAAKWPRYVLVDPGKETVKK